MKHMTRVAALLLPFAVIACSRGTADDVAPPSEAQRLANAADTIVVYKTPTCGCCNDWVDHVREYGYTVVTQDLNDLTQVKQQLGVPAGRVSCHTAVVRGYTVEGHVPADLIQKMLAERPRFRGLTVPGMPVGSPGMEGPWKDDYDVLAFDDDGNIEVYARR
ncbi:MAG TPA: DUF411 domain-containing protein [Longimicrobiales bacterium]|nr:DUF411 domain-containing protein [Longimicrobiales bacterium]